MTIGIIGAFDKEIEKIIDIFKLEREENNKRIIYKGTFQNKNLIICNSGIGKTNSASITQYIIDKYNVAIIINSGCAGSLKSSVKIMDIIISSYVTYHDFTPTRIMNFSTPDNGKIKANKNLIKLAEKTLKETNNKYLVAPITSGDCFVTNNVLRDTIYQNTKAACVDMESASIGHVARLNNIPFITIRTISDFSDGIDNFEEEAAIKSSEIVSEIIKKI